MSDTIAAIATPPGRGGVGIVRVSGHKVKDICKSLINSIPPARYAKFAPFLNADGTQIDEGLSLFFAGPNSFTGEDVLELHAHGGPVVLDMLMRRVVELGARLARAGEFSERAFLNNKIDLLQAEAVAELINASSEQAAIAATRSLQGEFSRKINALVEDLIRLRLYVEAAIDFPDEEIDFLADAHVQDAITNLLQRISAIYDQAKQGVLLSDGMNVAIIGKPNAGKSTLLNALTGQDTAIVTPIAGTTRDTIKAQIDLDGLLLNVVDTAGLRDTDDIVEQHGIARAKQAISMADLILLVVDVTEDHDPLSIHAELNNDIKASAKIIVVQNKIDQTNQAAHVQQNEQGCSVIAISAHTGLGLDLLRAQIKEVAGVKNNPEGGLFLARRRHLDALSRAQNYVLNAQKQLTQRAGELLADELKQAQLALSEITGAFTADDLLGRIFSEFCIGK